MLPTMSFFTGLKAAEPRTSTLVSHDRLQLTMLPNPPNSVDKLSAASRNSVVEMALSLEASTGTSTKLLLTVSKKVPPGGYAAAIVIEVCSVVFVM
jgi:hypothetical protein